MRRVIGSILIALLPVTAGCNRSEPLSQLHLASGGVARKACANNDGPAVELVVKVNDKLPAAPEFTGPEVGGQEFHVRVNATFESVQKLGRWSIQKPDADGGMLAWVCPVGGYPCNDATCQDPADHSPAS